MVELLWGKGDGGHRGIRASVLVYCDKTRFTKMDEKTAFSYRGIYGFVLTTYQSFLASRSIISISGSIMLAIIGAALRTDISRFAPGWIG